MIAQEAGGLLERAVAEARHLQELPAVPERRRARRGTRRCSSASVSLRPGDARQQRRRRGVDVGADRVDAVLDDRVELPRQLRLADVVLVLADADRLRLDPHQLGERILQAARDRDRAAQRHVEIGNSCAASSDAE